MKELAEVKNPPTLFTIISISSFNQPGSVVGGGGGVGDDGGELSKEDARQRFLENEIHKTSLKMTEVDKLCEVVLVHETSGGHGEEEVRVDFVNAEERTTHLL